MSGSMAGTALRWSEPGARWRSVAWGPAFALVGLVLEPATGATPHPWLWLAVAVLLGGLTALQVSAARTHTGVALTDRVLRQGRAELAVAEIARVHGPSARTAFDDPFQPWECAPALGGPTVPRGRTGVGLDLTDGRVVQAWARDDAGLRAALRELVPA
ncbi:membrane protein [Rhodococcus aerolatus]